MTSIWTGRSPNADIQRICREFYAAIGLPIDDVLARSDLYEKPGKSPHAFCTDIDREGDVRVLANIRPTEYWMGTMLHELGHAVYSSKNIPAELPWTLRTDAHIMCTEGVAMMFERFSKSADWLKAFGVEVREPRRLQRRRRADAPRPAADLLPLVPGHVPLREGAVPRPVAGPEQAVVGPGRKVSAAASGPKAAAAPTTPAKSTSSRPRPTTTTTCSASSSPASCTRPSPAKC